MADKKPKNNARAGGKLKPFSLKDDDIVARRVSRRSALRMLGITASAGALGALLVGCAGIDADPYDGISDNDPYDPAGGGGGRYGRGVSDNDSYDPAGGGGGYGRGGGGGGGRRYSDVKLGDGSDYTVYADFNDLDSDSRDVSDHFNSRSADRSGLNDYD